MALRFKLVQRRNPQEPSAPQKYYATVVPNGKRTLKNLSERVASHTTMSAPDVYGVLMALEEEIIAALKDGAKVELGDLCSFYPVVQSDGVESPDDFNGAKHIKRKSVRVAARQSLVRNMENVSVEKVES